MIDIIRCWFGVAGIQTRLLPCFGLTLLCSCGKKPRLVVLRANRKKMSTYMGTHMAGDKRQRMAAERRELYKSLGFLSSAGICMVASILIGMAMGYYLDIWLGTKPWLLLIFLGFGIVSGFRNIFILTERELRRQDKLNRDHSDQLR